MSFTTEPIQISQSVVSNNKYSPVVEEHQDLVEWKVYETESANTDPYYKAQDTSKVSGHISVIKYRKVGDVCTMSISTVNSAADNVVGDAKGELTKARLVPYEVAISADKKSYVSTATQYLVPKRFLPYLQQVRELTGPVFLEGIKEHGFSFCSSYQAGNAQEPIRYASSGRIRLCNTRPVGSQQFINEDSGELELQLFSNPESLASADDAWQMHGICTSWVCESNFNNIALNDKVKSAVGDTQVPS